MSQVPVIVGAGPAGMLCALLLAQRGIPSLLLDQATFPRSKTCGDALSGKAIRALHQLETALPTQLAALPHTIAYDRLQLNSPSGRQATLPLPPNDDLGGLAPGYLIRRHHLDNWLLAQAGAQQHITIKTDTKVVLAEAIPGRGIRLVLASGEELVTPIAIGADGARSILATSLAGHTLRRKHHAAAIRAYYTNVADLSSALELHFLKAIQPGYLWVFRMPDGVANVGIICRSDVVARKRLNLTRILNDTLDSHSAFSARFAQAHRENTAEGQGLPLAFRKRQIAGANFLLLGDAAGLADPFTYEGIGNALLSATLAADTISKAYAASDFTAKALRGYKQQLHARLHKELLLSRFLQRASCNPMLLNTGICTLHYTRPLAAILNWAVRRKRKSGL